MDKYALDAAKRLYALADKFDGLDEPKLADATIQIAEDLLEDTGYNKYSANKRENDNSTIKKEDKVYNKCKRCKMKSPTVKFRNKFLVDLCNDCNKVTKFVGSGGEYIYPIYKREKKAQYDYGVDFSNDETRDDINEDSGGPEMHGMDDEFLNELREMLLDNGYDLYTINSMTPTEIRNIALQLYDNQENNNF